MLDIRQLYQHDVILINHMKFFIFLSCLLIFSIGTIYWTLLDEQMIIVWTILNQILLLLLAIGSILPLWLFYRQQYTMLIIIWILIIYVGLYTWYIDHQVWKMRGIGLYWLIAPSIMFIVWLLIILSSIYENRKR